VQGAEEVGVTVKDMEAKLLKLQEDWRGSRDPRVRDAYRALHARWMAAKNQGRLP
jgi:hypothetical protein